ncbi:MAG: hypothetical protein E6Q25_07800 [Acinetobacter sp.]|nr:MAG: hypothetical protein E6Q25_07800 [Acinetobacter sp.]
MALNVGEHFRQRWLATPETVRQTYCDELKFICTLLEPDTHIMQWQQQEILLQQRHRQMCDRAYHLLKQDILAEQARLAEERKRQRQAELEHALAEKRAAQQAQLDAQEQQEQLKQQQQTELLQQLAQDLQQQTLQQAQQDIARFDVSQAKQFNHHAQSQNEIVDNLSASPQVEDLKIRLELEAEYYIEQTLQQLRAKLHAAAQEEIALILAQQ